VPLFRIGDTVFATESSRKPLRQAVLSATRSGFGAKINFAVRANSLAIVSIGRAVVDHDLRFLALGPYFMAGVAPAVPCVYRPQIEPLVSCALRCKSPVVQDPFMSGREGAQVPGLHQRPAPQKTRGARRRAGFAAGATP